MTDAEKAEDAWFKCRDAVFLELGRVSFGGTSEAGLFAFEMFQAGYQAAKAESPWVPIADIPEEWKGVGDKPVLLTGGKVYYDRWDETIYQIPFVGELFIGVYDRDDPNHWIGHPCGDYKMAKPTHAMLPLIPQKKDSRHVY